MLFVVCYGGVRGSRRLGGWGLVRIVACAGSGCTILRFFLTFDDAEN
jgi:hypothetical protein